jgi:hypothetical protein
MCRKQGERAILGQTFLERKKQRVLLKTNLNSKTSGHFARYLRGIWEKREEVRNSLKIQAYGIYTNRNHCS